MKPNLMEDGLLEGINPRDGTLWNLKVSATKIQVIRNLGVGAARELAFTVPKVVRQPTSIFRGLRERPEEQWLCYAGLPDDGYDRQTGERFTAKPGEIFLVFVNDQLVIYNWRWEVADPQNPRLPGGHDTRFIEKLL